MTRWSTTVTAAAVAELASAVRRRRPEIGDAPPVLIGDGISTLAYGMSASDGDWVLRVSRDYPRPWTWRGGRAHEVELAAELRRVDVPVPADATVVEEVDGLPRAILERRVLGTPLTAGGLATNPRLTSTIAAVLDRIHSIDIAGPITRGLTRDDPVLEFRQALAQVDLADDLRARVEAAIMMLEERASIRVLCHRDFRLEHLIIDDGQLVGLLDIGEIGVDDPAVDLAFLHGELGAGTVAEICARMQTADADPGLGTAARTIHSLWPLLELAPGGETWGEPATARTRLHRLL